MYWHTVGQDFEVQKSEWTIATIVLNPCSLHWHQNTVAKILKREGVYAERQKVANEKCLAVDQSLQAVGHAPTMRQQLSATRCP